MRNYRLMTMPAVTAGDVGCATAVVAGNGVGPTQLRRLKFPGRLSMRSLVAKCGLGGTTQQPLTMYIHCLCTWCLMCLQ
jgi:hypothetical protein